MRSSLPQRALPAWPCCPPQPAALGPYLPPRRPRGAWAQPWATSLLCCGAPSSEKQREHIRSSQELPIVLSYCFTTLKSKMIFRPKKTCRAAVQSPSPGVSVIRGKLMRCQVLPSSRKEKGSMVYCASNCIFPFKVCVLILHPWTRWLAPFSCLAPAERKKGKGNGRLGPSGAAF